MEKLSHGSSASSSVLNATQQDTSNDPGTVAVTDGCFTEKNPEEYF